MQQDPCERMICTTMPGRPKLRQIWLILMFLLYPGSLFLVSGAAVMAAPAIVPTVETQPVSHDGDAADDPAVWIHPTDSARSTIIGTDKAVDGGLAVYDLSGNLLQTVSTDGRMNNVDIRYNFPLGGQLVDIVTATNVSYNSISVYRVNSSTRRLENIAASRISVGMPVYGLCMYRSPTSGKYYAFATKSIYGTTNTGEVRQFELFDNGAGKVAAKQVRSFEVGSENEGCVADDVFGTLYIAETKKAIWKYSAEPNAGSTRTQVDFVGSGQLSTELEGITIYYTARNTGYLIVSQQCCSNFAVYRREGNNDYVTTFKIAEGNGIDAVAGTDGLDVSNFALGPAFPQGVFIAHDGYNDTANGNFTNYKLVPWERIANAMSPALTIDTTWNPRQVGAAPTPPPSPSPTPQPSTPPSPSPTPQPSTRPNPAPARTYMFTPDADTYVQEANPGANYGKIEELHVDGGADSRKESYIRFAVTGITQNVRGAKLRVFTKTGTSNGPAVYLASNTWTETSMTWNGKPTRTSGVLDDKGVVGSGTWLEFDVFPEVKGNGTYSFVVITSNVDGLTLSAREGGAPPQLVLTTAHQINLPNVVVTR